MDNIRTIYCDMPSTIGGYTLLKDGYYTIVLNSKLSHGRNLETYAHELKHIWNGDFESKASADLIEFYAHRG